MLSKDMFFSLLLFSLLFFSLFLLSLLLSCWFLVVGTVFIFVVLAVLAVLAVLDIVVVPLDSQVLVKFSFSVH